MNFRTISLATILFAATIAFGGVGDAAPESPFRLTEDVAAICGDGGIGEGCNCPHLGLPGKDPVVPIDC